MKIRKRAPKLSNIWRSTGTSTPKWEIHAGDARKVLGLLTDERFSCVVTSPPYFWQRDYGVGGQIGMEASVSDYVQSIVDTMSIVKRVLKKDGTLFLNLGDTYYSGKGKPHGCDMKHRGRRMNVLRAVDASGLGFPKKSQLGLPWRIATAMIDEGWTLRSSIIWRRSRPLPEANVLDRPWRTYEFVFLFSKSARYHFDRSALEEAEEEDVWSIDAKSVPGRTHPAAFPKELVTRCLDVSGIRRGEVLDPFAGSCTVLKVAVQRGLSATGIDLNREFCSSAASELSRITSMKANKPIFSLAPKTPKSLG
ncbi:MAG TPA: site-specific DNA-methyltransferase [Tepidisphaeraceae bacterium]|jgi:DNA modification methylase|nr:site-specific DNA-methyltransferase [Tepidisphaeraceae bacterium]